MNAVGPKKIKKNINQIMKPTELREDEKVFVYDDGDRVFLEIIKGMSLEELRSFDIYGPRDVRHYNNIQLTWLTTEKHFIQNRAGHIGEVSNAELLEDIDKYHNAERFRVFYVLKYPNMVKRYATS
jgi:hypothetical protein